MKAAPDNDNNITMVNGGIVGELTALEDHRRS